MRRPILILTLICAALLSSAQVTQPAVKRMTAVRTTNPPDIDGLLNDEAWKSATPAKDFVELRPVPGRLEPRDRATEVRIVYDNTAIYVGARMYAKPDSIAREIAERDQVGNADFIGVIFDTYYDKLNGNGFYVTAAGSQYDAKYSNSGNEDSNWNGVWLSKVHHDAEGWTAEMKIPYSALRFSGKNVQEWGVNFTRRNQFTQVQTFWSTVDPKKNGFINQEGIVEGITNIEPPVRLSLSPYVSQYLNYYPDPVLKNTSSTFNGGMDLKYGINDAFTLDMTLVPDFGQVQSDNRVLNLSPFEVRYNENRQFFTEGTEMFSKGDLFYSRRIGDSPYYDIDNLANSDEHAVSTPTAGKLLNATKISGRTAHNLGIGFFNAIVGNTYGVVQDAAGNRRQVRVQPFTNYNIFVLDQALKNNSYVTVINTNVTRQGDAHDANATGLLFSINDKKNVYGVSGSARTTHLNDVADDTGYSFSLTAGKQSGSFTAYVTEEQMDAKFNVEDMGYQQQNNYWQHSLNLGYSRYKPGKWYNQWQTWSNWVYSQRFEPRSYQYWGGNVGGYIQFKSLHSINFNYNYNANEDDFFEPRVAGRMFARPGNWNVNTNISTNRAKKYNTGVYLGYSHSFMFNGTDVDISWYHNIRVSNKLAIGNDIYYNPQRSNVGFTAIQSLPGGAYNIVFARRDRRTFENSMDVKYTFSPNMGIMLTARHYVSSVDNKAFYTLNTDGTLAANNTFTGNANRTDNYFNIDMVYSWVFSPGSTLSVAYKDASSYYESMARTGYFSNFSRVTGAPQNNNLSVKLLYYIDYQQLKRKPR